MHVINYYASCRLLLLTQVVSAFPHFNSSISTSYVEHVSNKKSATTPSTSIYLACYVIIYYIVVIFLSGLYHILNVLFSMLILLN